MRCTWRRFRVLLVGLPRDARYWRTVTNGASGWGETDYLLATLIDAVQIGNYQRQLVHFKGRPAAPQPIPRPRPRNTNGRSIAEMRVILDTWSEVGDGGS